MKYNDLIERALTVLRNDTVLAEKVNEFRFGELDNDVAEQYPAIHVLTYRPYQSGDSIGTGHSGDLQSSTTINIKILVSNAEVRVSSMQINELVDNVIVALKNNPTFTDGDGKDPMLKRSLIASTEVNRAMAGKAKQVANVEVYGQSGSSYTLTIGKNIYDVIMKPTSRFNENLIPHFNTDLGLGGYAELGITESRMYELEYTPTLVGDLKTILHNRSPIDVVETIDGAEHTFRAQLANYALSVSGPDNLQTVTIMFSS